MYRRWGQLHPVGCEPFGRGYMSVNRNQGAAVRRIVRRSVPGNPYATCKRSTEDGHCALADSNRIIFECGFCDFSRRVGGIKHDPVSENMWQPGVRPKPDPKKPTRY